MRTVGSADAQQGDGWAGKDTYHGFLEALHGDKMGGPLMGTAADLLGMRVGTRGGGAVERRWTSSQMIETVALAVTKTVVLGSREGMDLDQGEFRVVVVTTTMTLVVNVVCDVDATSERDCRLWGDEDEGARRLSDVPEQT